MSKLFRKDYKEPRRPSALVAVLLALAILLGAGFVVYGGVEELAKGLNSYILDWEEKYDGIAGG